MVDRYPANSANRQRDTTSARTLRQAAAPGGVFRCDRCDRVVPDVLLVEQDGYDLCRTLCADEMSVSADNIRLAEQLAQTDSMAPNDSPPSNAFTDAVSITSTPTWPVRITNGGAAVALAFVGVGFEATTTIAYGHAGITDNTAPVITATTIDLDLVAAGVTAGLYNLTIAGKTYYRVLEING